MGTGDLTQSEFLLFFYHLSLLTYCRSGKSHLARHREKGKKTNQTEEEVGRQHQGMGKPGVCQVPEGSGDQRRMEKTGCEVTCGAATTLAVFPVV